MPLKRKPLPVLADSGYDSTELAEVWMFLDFTIRAFLNIPAKDGIFDQHLASSIQYRFCKSDCLTPILIISYTD